MHSKAQSHRDSAYADAFTLKGHYFIDKGKDEKRFYDSALYWHRQAFELRQTLFGNAALPVANALTNIALCYYILEKWDSAAYYYHKALDIQEQIKASLPKEQSYQIIDSYRSVSHCYFQKGDILTARIYSEKSLHWLSYEKNIPSQYQSITSAAYNEWGQCLHYLGDIEGAIKAIRKAVQMVPKTDRSNHAAYLTYLGSAYADKKSDSALIFFNNALLLRQNINEKEERAKVFIKIGDFYAKLNRFENANYAYRAALSSFDNMLFPFLAATCWTNLAKIEYQRKHFDNALTYIESALRLLSFKINLDSEYPLEVLIALTERAKIIFEKTNLTPAFSNWVNALEAYEIAIQFGEKYEKQIQNAESALILRGYFHDRYGGAAEICVRLGNFDASYFEKGLTYAERGKAFLFKTKTEDIPNNQLLQLIRKQHPHSTVVAYCFGPKNLLAFYITHTDFKTITIPLEGIKTNVQGLYHSISTPFESNIKRDFAQEASFLYDRLLAEFPLEDHTPLVIIPDDILHYLPFDVLLKQPPSANTSWAEYDYLLHHHAIRYQAAAFLPLPNKTKAQGTLLAFAPHFNNHPMGFLNPLRFNSREIDSIHTILSGILKKNQDAIKNTFVEQSPFYKYLHLSTHGIAHDMYPEQSFLAFSPIDANIYSSILTVEEIEKLDIHADLVVLSACQTATGTFYGGEGLMSLSRAFLAAGGRSVVASLWSVDELRTMNLLVSFYKNLDKGLSKSEALQLAKLDMIKKSTMAAHPYFWAAFTVTGDDTPLSMSTISWLKWGVVLLILSAFILYKFKRKEPF